MGGVVSHVLPLQEHVYLPEGGPDGLLSVPALAHEVVDLLGAVPRHGQHRLEPVVPVAMAGVLNHLLVTQAHERLLTGQGQDLPQGHRERPNVTLTSELALGGTWNRINI